MSIKFFICLVINNLNFRWVKRDRTVSHYFFVLNSHNLNFAYNLINKSRSTFLYTNFSVRFNLCN